MDAKGELSRDAILLRTWQEELLNTLTHGFGLLLSAVGVALLLTVAISHGSALLVAGCAAYLCSLVSVYATSTLSHYVQWPDTKRQLRTWDQGLIYFLTVGSYTPMAILYLPNGNWWLLFGLMWCYAACGFLSKVILQHRIDAVSTLSYILLASLQIPAIQPIIPLAPSGAILWYATGGMCYFVGVAFLVFDRKAVYLHAIWHLFVIAGSTCQFLAIYRCVAQ